MFSIREHHIIIWHRTRMVQGTSIRSYMTAIPYDTEPPPIIHAYVDLNLNILKTHNIIAQPGSGAPTRDASAVSSCPLLAAVTCACMWCNCFCWPPVSVAGDSRLDPARGTPI